MLLRLEKRLVFLRFKHAHALVPRSDPLVVGGVALSLFLLLRLLALVRVHEARRGAMVVVVTGFGSGFHDLNRL